MYNLTLSLQYLDISRNFTLLFNYKNLVKVKGILKKFMEVKM